MQFCELAYLRGFSTDPGNGNVLDPTAPHGAAAYILVVMPLRNVQKRKISSSTSTAVLTPPTYRCQYCDRNFKTGIVLTSRSRTHFRDGQYVHHQPRWTNIISILEKRYLAYYKY